MNEHELPGGQTPAGGISAPFWGEPERMPVPEPPSRKPFSASRRELIAALASYLLAWWYLWRSPLFLGGLSDHSSPIWTLVFTLGFVALAELLFWGIKRPWESWIWLGCLGAILVSLLLWPDWDKLDSHAWDPVQRGLFLHLAAVWWVLSRSGRLTEGKTGHLLPLDGLQGFVLFPFKHFYLRIRTLICAAGRFFRERRRIKGVTLLWSFLALVIAGGLFVLALTLLTDADAGFDKLMGGVADWFRFWDPDYLFRFLLSLPVGQYLFGLLAGTGREEPEKLRRRGESFCKGLEELHQVPNLVWIVLTGAFCLLYLVFFAVQGRYLFGAFTRSLPEGFIVSEYARQGFFELCRVMGVNFALLWLVTRLCRVPVRENRAARITCLILLLESMLFAVVAFSKLLLYIDCFGFTPLRLQSSWLVCVLFAGCLAAGWSLVTGKKSFRVWFTFAAVSASLLCLV